MNTSVLRLVIETERDVFLVRQRGREVAGAVGLDRQDQIRIAAALSDLGRDLLRQCAKTTVDFQITDLPVPGIAVEFTFAAPVSAIDTGDGWSSARRLMDEVNAESAAGTDESVVVLVKKLPNGTLPLSPPSVAVLREKIGHLAQGNALDELRAQNAELLRAMDDLERKQAELTRLNAELHETNQGVLALYKELSDELEQTNRGVVALYAELDEKSNQLKEASAAKNRFWSHISHELRSPINSVIGLARLMNAPEAEPLTEEQRRQTTLIQDSGLALLGLVNELLDTAKAESGQLKPDYAPVRLDAVFAQLRGTLRPLVAGDEVTLHIEQPTQLPLFVTDEVLLTRILRNLLSNGLKFTQHGGVRLTVSADSAAGRLIFAVTDTGIGIPADQQERVFEDFYQVRGSAQANVRGTGLGLPYSRRLAEILGGTLELDSEPGHGTRVVLRLPIRPADSAGDLADLAVHTVLIVDDDAEFRDRLAAIVTGFATHVVEASDGGAALELVAEHRPDLIILDLLMPGETGDQVAARIRQDPLGRDLPIMIVTSADPAGFDLSALGPASDVLSKSDLSPDAVRHRVRQMLKRSQETRQA